MDRKDVSLPGPISRLCALIDASDFERAAGHNQIFRHVERAATDIACDSPVGIRQPEGLIRLKFCDRRSRVVCGVVWADIDQLCLQQAREERRRQIRLGCEVNVGLLQFVSCLEGKIRTDVQQEQCNRATPKLQRERQGAASKAVQFAEIGSLTLQLLDGLQIVLSHRAVERSLSCLRHGHCRLEASQGVGMTLR